MQIVKLTGTHIDDDDDDDDDDDYDDDDDDDDDDDYDDDDDDDDDDCTLCTSIHMHSNVSTTKSIYIYAYIMYIIYIHINYCIYYIYLSTPKVPDSVQVERSPTLSNWDAIRKEFSSSTRRTYFLRSSAATQKKCRQLKKQFRKFALVAMST